MGNELGYAMQVRRAMLGISRKDAAAAAGLSYPYWSELETGSKDPSWRSLTAIATALRFDRVSSLIAFTERCADERAALP